VNNRELRFGILDLGYINDMSSAGDSVDNTVEYAIEADRLGFSRFWVGEHHEDTTAWRSPEALIGVLAERTSKIRIGSGGICLPLHSTLRVAQNFRMFNHLYSGRIDLGIAKGTTVDRIANYLVGPDQCELNSINHIERVQEVLRFLSNADRKEGGNETIWSPPYNNRAPQIWILGSSGKNALKIIDEQCSYCFSFFHNQSIESPERILELLKMYEQKIGRKPLISLAVACQFIDSRTNNLGDSLRSFPKSNFRGTITECIKDMFDLSHEFKIQEIMIVNLCENQTQRLSDLRALAKGIQAYEAS